ncbi:MAG: hypothetical protein WD512_00455, partial [Candidatus Paceibacterota bacterium]
SAFALLTKGPIGLILIGMPIFFYCCYQKNLKSLIVLPWLSGTILFLLISVPWFYLVEKANPGSVWYFFVHENFYRYITKEYGGKYGDAHLRPYGSIWWMLVISMLPWSLYLIRDLIQRIVNFKKRSSSPNNNWVFFVLIVGLSPILFFTVARSILPAYVIPAIPGLALYLGHVLFHAQQVAEIKSESLLSEDRSYLGKLLRIEPSISKLSIGLFSFLVMILFSAVPFIEDHKSSSQILRVIADQTQKKNLTVGILATNNYSPYWTAGAYQEELSKPLKIEYVSTSDLNLAKYKNLIIRGNDSKVLVMVAQRYKKHSSHGNWHWYRRINRSDV